MKKLTKNQLVMIAKSTSMLVAGLGCATVVGLAVGSLIPIDSLSRYQKTMVAIGVGMFGAAAADLGGTYAGNLFDACITIPLMNMEEMIQAMKAEEEKKVILENPA
jgi:hypothetical protein